MPDPTVPKRWKALRHNPAGAHRAREHETEHTAFPRHSPGAALALGRTVPVRAANTTKEHNLPQASRLASCLLGLAASLTACGGGGSLVDGPAESQPMRQATAGAETSCKATLAAGADIQAAINQVSSAGGGMVCLSSGTWTLSQSLLMRSNITLRGAGLGTVLQGPASVYNWPLISVPTDSTPSNATVSDLRIDGRVPFSAAFNPSNGYKNALGMFFFDSDGAGSQLTISGVEVHNTSEAIHVKGYNGVVIKDSHFHDNGVMLSSTLGNHNFYLLRVTNATISNVRANNSWTGDGLHLRYMFGTTVVKDSTFVGNYRLGIHTQLGGNGSEISTMDLQASGNDLSYNGSEVVNLTTYNGKAMNGFDIETTTGSITANTAVGNLGKGILARNGSGSITGNVALGNQINPQIDSFRGLTVSANTTSGAPIANGTYRLVSVSSLALGTAGSAANATSYASQASQRWQLTHLGNSEYSIVNAASNLALTAPSSSGATVTVNAYTATNAQKWRVITNSGGAYRMCAKSLPGACLAASGSVGNVFPYGGTSGERWAVTAP